MKGRLRAVFPDFDLSSHASEVVCVSIGANLLLPAAPSILSKLLVGIDTNPKHIVSRTLVKNTGLTDYVMCKDFETIGRLASNINSIRERCDRMPGLVWKTIDFMSAFLGFFLLWSGWVGDPHVSKWCGLLILPSVFAVLRPFVIYLFFRLRLSWRIMRILANAAKRREEAEARNTAQVMPQALEEFMELANSEIQNMRSRPAGKREKNPSRGGHRRSKKH